MAWHSTWNNDSPPPRGGGFFVDRGGAFPPGVKLVLILTVAVFVLQLIGFNGWLTAWGAVTYQSLRHLELWRLVTYMFLHAGGWHLIFNMFLFWMLGSVLERQMGTRPFLWLYFVGGAVGGLFEAIFNYLMYLQAGPPYGELYLMASAVGASAGVAGILIAFAMQNPHAKFLLFFLVPIEAWWLAVCGVVIDTWPLMESLLFHVREDNVAHAAHFGGMVVGFIWIWGGRRIGQLLRPVLRPRPTAYVERPPDEEEAELNRILDKIHREGLDGLTLRERMFLQEISRKRRGEE
jgi:membrane associated rhomboid family serine protease